MTKVLPGTVAASSPQREAEGSRMISEKIAAASSGVFEAAKSRAAYGRDITSGKTPLVRPADAPSVFGYAAITPGLKALKAKAN